MARTRLWCGDWRLKQKLAEAARHWARSAKQPKKNPEAEHAERQNFNIDQAAWDAAGSWADDDETAPAGDLLPDGSFGVWPENVRTVSLFCSVRRCWRVAPMGGLMGFDWIQVEARLRQKGVTRPRALRRELDRLEIMENAALEELHRG
jgi:hypothetical protein